MSAKHDSHQCPGNSLNVTPKVDSWAGKGVDQGTFGPIAAPQLEENGPKEIPTGA